MIHIRDEVLAHIEAREDLLDAAMGEARLRKTSERLREGRMPARGLSLVAEHEGQIVGSVRLWHITAGPGRPSLLLGPLAVDASLRGCGVGGRLMNAALGRAAGRGHASVLLVGDAQYYSRFGFTAAHTGKLWLPGPYARDRFLGLELTPGALAGAAGLVSATGVRVPEPALLAAKAAFRQAA